MCVVTGKKSPCFFFFFLVLSTGRSKCRVTHTTAPLEVIIFQCSAEQMMQTWGLNTVLHVRLYCISMPDNMDDVDLKPAHDRRCVQCSYYSMYCTLLVITTQFSATTHAVFYNASPPQVWSSQIQTISCAIHHILLPG